MRPFLANLAVLGGVRKPFVVALGAAIWAFIASIDQAAGPHAPFSLFYVFPIALVTWYASVQWGLLLSVFGGVVTFALIYRTIPLQASIASVVWLMLAKIGSFVVVGFLISGLKRSQEAQRSLANTDHLTQIANNRAFRNAAEVEIARLQRTGEPLSVLFLDCDDFKSVNDRLGHGSGDELLQIVARTLRESIRQTDVAGRVGGDEFALLLPGVASADAPSIAEKIRRALLARMAEGGWPVTFSIGVAVFERPPTSVEELLSRADALQYRAKLAGKDRVVCETLRPERPAIAA